MNNEERELDLALAEAEQENRLLRARNERLERELAATAPAQEPTVDDNSQDWQGMDGATAWHLIDRHANGWADVGKMMGEWLDANKTVPPAPAQEPYGWHTEDHLTDRSATTYSKDVADRWLSKGWPLTPFYTTPPAPTQEPYGYFRYDIQLDAWVQNKEANVGVAFYTEPPKREWVALTENEIFKLYMGSGCTDIEDCEGFEKVAKVVEAKLKEKNT